MTEKKEPSIKVGLGYDVHRLSEGRKLFLGGVEIPSSKGLLGHSDADVLLHAICDAMLGAVGRGDIGEHFPDTDEQYKNISSLVLLKRVQNLVDAAGYAVSNIDAVILAEEPRLGPHKEQMRECIAREVGCEVEEVNIKATTTEGLGFVGKKEGMAAYAAVIVTSKI